MDTDQLAIAIGRTEAGERWEVDLPDGIGPHLELCHTLTLLTAIDPALIASVEVRPDRLTVQRGQGAPAEAGLDDRLGALGRHLLRARP